MSRRRLSAGLAALAGVVMALSACGGGGGGGGAFGVVPPGSGGGGTPQDHYSAEQRSAATGRIAEKFEQLAAADGATEASWTALRDWVLTQPEYNAAGVGDKLLWARFTDGRYFVYTDNWRPIPAQPAGSMPMPKGAAVQAKASQAIAAATGGAAEVPGSANALLLRFDGPEFSDGNAAMARMPKALAGHGWKVAPDQALTIAALKNRGELGLLFLTSHSGMFGPEGEKEFSLMLGDEVTVGSEIEHLADLDAGRLIYHRDRDNWQRLGFTKNPRYAATSRFVAEYLQFSSNSLVILLSCNSGADQAKAFRDAFTAKGAATVIGWNGNSNGYAFQTADLLIDRLTGSNVEWPRSPPNRAFNMTDVWAYLERQGLLITPPIGPLEQPSFVKLWGGGFDLSNPVITQLQAAADDKLFIHGDFGSTPGSLTIGGTPVAFEKWDSKVVEVNLPTGPNDPPGSLGDVVVKARERTSNPRTLTSWRGQISYLLEDLPDGGGAGVLANKITVDLHLRGDAFARRTEVDGALSPNTWNVIPASDTRVTYEASGTRNHGADDVETWQGRGAYEYSMNHRFNAATEAKMAIVARIDAINRRFEITPLFSNIAPGIVRTRTDNGLPTVPSGLMRMPPFDMQFMNETGNLNDHHPLVYGTYLPFGANGNVPAGQHAATEDELRRVIQWGAMTALPALDDGIGR